jgi:Leucine-rich repeat (LRR) protein
LEKNQICIPNPEATDPDAEPKVTHDLVRISEFKCLKNLKVRYNQIHRFPSAEKFAKLEFLNVEFNDITDARIITDISKMPMINNIRILKNPIADKETTRHIRNRCVGEMRNLTVMNGSEISKYQRRDYEIYYLRWVFHEYFR